MVEVDTHPLELWLCDPGVPVQKLRFWINPDKTINLAGIVGEETQLEFTDLTADQLNIIEDLTEQSITFIAPDANYDYGIKIATNPNSLEFLAVMDEKMFNSDIYPLPEISRINSRF